MRCHASSGAFAFALICATWACSESDGSPADGGAGSAGGTSANGGTSAASGSGGNGGSSGTGMLAGNGGALAGGSAGQGASGGAATTGGGGGADAAGNAGTNTGGSGGTPPGLDSCPAPPAGASQATVDALNAVNTLRLAMGLECMELITELNTAAQNHCDYYQTNIEDEQCTGNAHGEVASCTGYTGATPGQRMDAAGYEGSGGWSEVMAFSGDAESAVAQWVNSVWHRTPLLSPWWRHMGYGGSEDCDTIDLGTGPETPDDVTALYPYPGQTGVPVEFHGDREGPTPPEPTTGWPSASPIHIYVRDAEVVSHRIDVEGTDAPLDHVFIDYEHEDNGDSQYILYANEPFEPGTTYRVRASFSRGGQALDFDWTFTTEN